MHDLLKTSHPFTEIHLELFIFILHSHISHFKDRTFILVFLFQIFNFWNGRKLLLKSVLKVTTVTPSLYLRLAQLRKLTGDRSEKLTPNLNLLLSFLSREISVSPNLSKSKFITSYIILGPLWTSLFVLIAFSSPS